MRENLVGIKFGDFSQTAVLLFSDSVHVCIYYTCGLRGLRFLIWRFLPRPPNRQIQPIFPTTVGRVLIA